MKSGLDAGRVNCLLAISCLILATVACVPMVPTLTPTRPPALTAVLPSQTPTASMLPSGLSTRALTPVPTAIPPTSKPISVACPPSGSPALVQPDGFAGYSDAIQAYLSAGGDLETLRAKLTDWRALPDTEDQVVATDLNGDGIGEVVLSVVDPQGHVIAPAGMLLVFACSGGAYARRYRDGRGEGETLEPSIEILQVDDLTTDGLPDVAYVLRTCGAHTCYERLRILSWDGDQLGNRIEGTLELPYPAYVLDPGCIEAISGGIGSVGAEPQRGYKEIWRWNGEVFTRTQTVYQPPVYRYHALLDGDRALHSGDYVTATEAYRRVIGDETLKAWGGVSSVWTPAEERAQLSAFAHWRLVLTNLLRDRPDEAQAVYETLRQDYAAGPGHDVARMATSFWMAYQRNRSVPDECATIVAAAESYLSVLDFFNRSYGYANPHWEPRDLCPF